jgi:hypothetical protein
LGSHYPWQIRAPRGALIAHIANLLLRAVGADLGEKIDHLCVASVLLDQAGYRIATLTPAFAAGNI